MPIQINLDDHIGHALQKAKLDEHTPVGQLIPAMITSLRLPITDPAGRPITYSLSHNNRRLQEYETLEAADIRPGDTLIIVPHMTAGPSHGEILLSYLESARDEIQHAINEVLAAPEDIQLDSLSTIRLRIIEEPLTAQNLSTIFPALTELHTKCWLIQQGRFGDLIEYTQTGNIRFAKEANLVIAKLTYNSPMDIKLNLDVSPKSVVEALKAGIDAITQAPLRREEVKLENQAKELDIKLRKLDSDIANTDKEQARQIAAQNAELEKQKTLLGIEKQQLEIEKQRLEVQERRLDMEKKRTDYALEIARMIVDILRPNADMGTREMLLGTLLPSLLQLGNGKGLELALPASTLAQQEIGKFISPRLAGPQIPERKQEE